MEDRFAGMIDDKAHHPASNLKPLSSFLFSNSHLLLYSLFPPGFLFDRDDVAVV